MQCQRFHRTSIATFLALAFLTSIAPGSSAQRGSSWISPGNWSGSSPTRTNEPPPLSIVQRFSLLVILRVGSESSRSRALVFRAGNRTRPGSVTFTEPMWTFAEIS